MVTPMKRNLLALLLAVVVLALAVPMAQAKLVAKIDRDQISPDETFNLTLGRDSGSAFSSVDLQPLEKDFSVLGRSQSSSTQFVNGSVTSAFNLILSLAPKHSGVLTIPPLTVGGDSSEPLTVKVFTQPQPKTRADTSAIFLESEVDTHSVVVQEQVLLTLRIYVAVQAQLAEPELPQLVDALVEKLTDARYHKVVNGRSYEVFERKFAIIPQKSGVLEIPPLRVRATVPSRSLQPDDVFGGFFGARQKEVNLASNPDRITVREKAAGYPAGAVWLPTTKLTVAVDWSRDPKDLKVGDSATVTISLAAQGLLAAQLPPVVYPDTEGVKIYQGKGELQNVPKGDGVTGLRKESIAVIPTRPGSMVLSEIRIPWWNKNTHVVEYATIPAQHLLAKGSAVAPPPSSGAPMPEPTAPAAASGTETMPAVSTAAASRFPLLVAAVSGKEREAYRALAGACQGNNAGLARKTFWAWAKVFRAGEMMLTTSDLDRVFPGSGLVPLLEEIDRKLYGNIAAVWQGQELLAAVAAIRKAGNKADTCNSPLPPLYR